MANSDKEIVINLDIEDNASEGLERFAENAQQAIDDLQGTGDVAQAIKELIKYLKQAAQQTENLAGGTRGQLAQDMAAANEQAIRLNDSLNTLVKIELGTIAKDLMTSFASAAGAVAGYAVQQQDALINLGLKIGETGETFELIKEASYEAFTNGLGEDLNSVIDVAQRAQKQLGIVDKAELSTVTEKLIKLSDQNVFGHDMEKQLDAVKSLMTSFGMSADEAFQFIVKGSQEGLDASGDFLQTISEYGTQFKDAGADAAQFYSLLKTGQLTGNLGIDKAADSVKEFSLKIREQGTETTAALNKIGINSQEFYSQINNGELKIIDAYQQVNNALSELNNTSLALPLGAAIIGTQYEDMGVKSSKAINIAAVSMSQLAATQTDFVNQNKTVTEEINRALRQVETAFMQSDFMEIFVRDAVGQLNNFKNALLSDVFRGGIGNEIIDDIKQVSKAANDARSALTSEGVTTDNFMSLSATQAIDLKNKIMDQVIALERLEAAYEANNGVGSFAEDNKGAKESLISLKAELKEVNKLMTQQGTYKQAELEKQQAEERLKIQQELAENIEKKQAALAVKQKQHYELSKQLETEQAAIAKQKADEVAQAKINSAQAALQGQQATLKQLETAEENYIQKIQGLREDLDSFRENSADKIRKLQRRSMSEAEQQADIEKEINERMQAANNALIQGNTALAQSEAEKAAKAAENLKNNDMAIASFEKAAAVIEKAKEKEIKATEKAAAENLKAIDSQNKAIEVQKQKIEAIEQEQILSKSLEIQTNVDQVSEELQALKAELQALEDKQVNINVNTNKNGADRNFAEGGSLLNGGLVVGAGSPTSDSIFFNSPTGRVGLSNTEYVVKGASVNKIGIPAMHALNRGDLTAAYQHLAAKISTPPAPRYFAEGGALGGQTGANTPPPALQPIVVNFPNSNKEITLHAKQEQAREFIENLQREL